MSYKIAPKILVYGGSASGKSYGLLQIPATKYIIDAEGGTLPYQDRFPFQGPEIVTDDPFFVRDDIARVMANPGDVTLIGIDPLTTIWNQLVDIADKEVRDRKKHDLSQFQQALDIGSWGPIKRIWRGLIADLRRASVPVIVTCREKIDVTTGARDPDCEKNIRFEFDTVLRTELVGDKRITYCDRDRWGKIPTGSSTFLPWNEVVTNAFREWWGHTGEPMPRPTPWLCQEFERLTASYKQETVITSLRSRGVTKFEDLTLTQAEALIVKLGGNITPPPAPETTKEG